MCEVVPTVENYDLLKFLDNLKFLLPLLPFLKKLNYEARESVNFVRMEQWDFRKIYDLTLLKIVRSIM